MQATLLTTTEIAKNIQTFTFSTEYPLSYVAGQFIEMTIPHENPDERGIKHWFTLSSSPTEENISITTKFFGEKASTFKKTLFGLKPGDDVQITAPEGDFTLPKNDKQPLVFIAGGIGITPYRSMLQWLKDTKSQRTIQLIYGVKKEDELAFRTLIQLSHLSFTPLVGKRLTSELLLSQIKNVQEQLIYISGPEPMVETLTKEFQAAGIEANAIKSDYFPNYSDI